MNQYERVFIKEARKEDHRRSNEYGFYIACDDRAILSCVNKMLLNSGMVGLSDKDGKIHYLIDGRRGGQYVADHLKSQVITLCENDSQSARYENALVYSCIDSVLHKYGLDPVLTGTQILRFLLYQLYHRPKLLRGVSKSLYPLAEPVFHMSVSQVERNIRYAVRKSGKTGPSVRVLAFIRELLDAVMEDVMAEYGRS